MRVVGLALPIQRLAGRPAKGNSVLTSMMDARHFGKLDQYLVAGGQWIARNMIRLLHQRPPWGAWLTGD